MSHWRSIAYVESPLQLIGVLEAHALGLLGTQTDLVVRDASGAIAPTILALRDLTLPTGLKWFGTKDTPQLPNHPAAQGSYAHVLGDPFSGQQQSGLLRHMNLKDVVIVDDGLNTYAAIEALAENKPMIRPGQQLSPARKALGMATTHALRKAAFSGHLMLCSAMPATERLLTDLAVVDANSTFHSFGWLNAQQVPTPPIQKAVIVGSGFVADGHIHEAHYLGWIAQLAANRDCLYVPHRRTDARLLNAISSINGVEIGTNQACIELTARGLQAGQEIHLLPTTALLTLGAMLTGGHVSIHPHNVPEHWWTDHTTNATRQFLSRPIEIYEGTRT